MSLAPRIDLDDETADRLERLAERRRVPSDLLLKDAIRQFVEREEKRETLVSELDTVWSDYQSSGLHLDDESADAWLARLESGEDADLPPWRG